MSDNIQQRLDNLEREIRRLHAQLRMLRQPPQPPVPLTPAPDPLRSFWEALFRPMRPTPKPDLDFIRAVDRVRENDDSEKSTLKSAPFQYLYRLKVCTYARGLGGTRGDAFFRFVGSTGIKNETNWVYCDNPASRFHQPGDVDLYYFYNADLGDKIEGHIALEANRTAEADGWCWEGWLQYWDNDKWVDKLHLPQRDTPATDNLDRDTFRNTGAAHLDALTKKWTVWKSPGFEFAEVNDLTLPSLTILRDEPAISVG